MSHDAIEVLIPWYALGSLGEEERGMVEEHLPDCASCRELLDDARGAAKLTERDFDGLLDHVHTQHLDAFARDPDAMELDLRRWIEEHVDGCVVCRESLEQIESSLQYAARGEDEAERSPHDAEVVEFPFWRVMKRTVLHPAAAALYLMAALVSIPAYRSVVGPQIGSRPDAVPAAPPTEPTGGVFDLNVISGQLRGTDSGTTIAVREGDPFVTIGAELELPGLLDDAAVIRFSIVRADGGAAWSATTTAAAARRNLAHSGVVTLVVPADRLRAGSYRLAAEAEGDTLLDAPFDVE